MKGGDDRVHRRYLVFNIGLAASLIHIHIFIPPPRDLFEISKNLRNSDKSREKKTGVKKNGV
jgi:hypothetical protein